jgi:hypothetical protein
MSILREITARRFDEMLNILPPMNWRTSDAFDQKFNRIHETFMMSEMLDERHITQFGGPWNTARVSSERVLSIPK